MDAATATIQLSTGQLAGVIGAVGALLSGLAWIGMRLRVQGGNRSVSNQAGAVADGGSHVSQVHVGSQDQGQAQILILISRIATVQEQQAQILDVAVKAMQASVVETRFARKMWTRLLRQYGADTGPVSHDEANTPPPGNRSPPGRTEASLYDSGEQRSLTA